MHTRTIDNPEAGGGGIRLFFGLMGYQQSSRPALQSKDIPSERRITLL